MTNKIKSINFNDSLSTEEQPTLERIQAAQAINPEDAPTYAQMASYCASIIAGAGAGAGLEVIEEKTQLEKLGLYLPISNKSYINESYCSDANLQLSLAKDYSTADTTTIYLDLNKSQIDEMDATTGWTATNGGTVTLDTGIYIEATGSVKLAHTTLNGTDGIQKSTFTAFSLIGKKLRCRVYLDTVTNVSKVQILAESTAGNNIYKDWLVANLVVGWNFLELDPLAYTGTTGTFVNTSVTILKIQVTTSSAQTINFYTDDICLVDNFTLPFPMQIQIYESSNTQLISIVSEDATIKGKFLLQATLSNNYARASSYSYQKNVSININQKFGQFKTGLSGNAAKTCYDINRKYLPDTFSSKKMDWSQYFYDDSFAVNSFPTTGSIKISSLTDKSGYFKNGDIVWLYHRKWNGINYDSIDENTVLGQNSIRLTLTADATYAGTPNFEITLTHSGNNSHGSDNTEWFVVRESCQFGYFVGNKSANDNIIFPTPQILCATVNSSFSVYTDIFSDRTANPPANGWTLNNYSVGGSYTAFQCSLGQGLYCETYNSSSNIYGGYLYRSTEDYFLKDSGWLEMNIQILLATSGGSPSGCYGWITTGVGATGLNGIGVRFIKYEGTSNVRRCEIVQNNTTGQHDGGTVLTTETLADMSNWVNIKLQVTKTKVRYKTWLTTDAEPATWSKDITHSATISNGIAIGAYARAGTGIDSYPQFRNMIIKRIDDGCFILKNVKEKK